MLPLPEKYSIMSAQSATNAGITGGFDSCASSFCRTYSQFPQLILGFQRKYYTCRISQYYDGIIYLHDTIQQYSLRLAQLRRVCVCVCLCAPSRKLLVTCGLAASGIVGASTTPVRLSYYPGICSQPRRVE